MASRCSRRRSWRARSLEPGTYDVVGLKSELTMEEWGPNLKIPGAAITADNVGDTRFWGNLTPPDQPVQVVE